MQSSINQTTLLDKLQRLKLSGVREAWEQQQLQVSTYEGMSMAERLELLLQREVELRDERSLQRRLREAKFRLSAQAAMIDYHHPRGIEKSQMMQLLQCDWIARGQNVLLQSPTGCGKTFLASALGDAACRLGYQVRYFRCRDLFNLLTVAQGDGRIVKVMAQLAKVHLLILDDWGLEPLTARSKSDLLSLLDDRHGRLSTIVSSQLPVDKWYEVIDEPTLADAILDRLIHNAHRLTLFGESMRKKQADLGTMGSI